MKEALKVLIAVDGSDSSLAVIDQAARLPWSEKSEVLIIGVAEMPSPIMAGPLPMPGTYYQEWEKALEDQAEANVAQAVERFSAGGGSRDMVATRTIKGHTKEAILDEAARFGANLIMIGTHGYNALERAWLGSVSRTVAAHAGCSVEIVRPTKRVGKGGMRLLVAVDGSPFGEAAVAEVVNRRWPAGSEVKVITAIHLPFVPTPETWALPDEYYAEAERASRDQAEKILHRAEEILQTGGTELSFSSEAILGHAEEVILGMAREWEADLILLGSHGHRAWERFLLGSVSQAVAWHAHCSVEIVRRDATPA
jgi:nucleotide-binding universal stress UspA family protein